MALTLGTTKQEGTISLNRAQAPSYSTEKTDELAAKYNLALGAASPGEDAVRNSLTTGNTRRLEELLNQQRQVELAGTRNELIQQIAVETGGTPTDLDLEVVRGLSMEQMTSNNLNTTLEEEYARKVVDTSTTLLDEEYNAFEEAVESDPDTTYELMDRVQNNAARNLILNNLIDEVNTKYSQANPLQVGKAWLQQIIPGRSTYIATTFLEGAPINALQLPGDTKREQIAYLYSLPPSEFKATLEQGIKNNLRSDAWLDVQDFLYAVQSYSDTDAGMANTFAVLDVADVAGVVGAGKLIRGLGRSAGKVVNNPVSTLVQSATDLNLTARAVKETFVSSIAEGKLPSFNIKRAIDAENTVPSIFRPSEVFDGSKHLDGPAMARLERAATARGSKAMEILTDINRVERLSADALEVAYKETQEALNSTFTHANHQIVNVQRNAAEDNIGNVYSVTVSFGQKNGNPFRSKKAAETYAKFVALKTDDYAIVPQGAGFVVNVSKNIDETSAGVRAVQIETNAKTPDTFANRFLGHHVFGADKLLSKDQTSARGVAALSGEHMSQQMAELTAPFTRLSKKETKDTQTFLASMRDYVDPKSGERGLSYHSVSEFEDQFAQRLGRAPSYAETDAAMAFKQAYDMDWIIRDLDVYKQKARMGVEELSIKFGDTDTKFEGKLVSELPRGSKTPFTVGVINNGKYVGRTPGAKYPTFRSNAMRQQDWDTLQAYIDDGYQIFQAYEGYANVGDTFTNFILSREVKRNQVGMMNLNYRKGSRVVQKYPNYVKQGRVEIDNGVARYKGDVGAANARSMEEATTIAKHLDQVRLMIKNSDPNLMKYIKDNLPMHDADDVIKQFSDGTFSLDVPFRALQSGTRSIDNFDMVSSLRAEGLSVNQFVTADEFDLSRQVQGRFLGERNDINMTTYKVEDGAVLRHDGDNLLSPFDTLRLSMSDMINTHVMHDYRIKSVSDYTTEFGDILDGTQADFLTNGMNFLYEPKYKTGVDANRIRIAENMRKSIMGLFNNKTIVDRQIDTYKDRLTTFLRGKLGDDLGESVADGAIHTLTNGDKWMRAAAFHSKMGFFNVKQLFLQSSAMVNIISISPKHGARGAAAYIPLRQAMYATNPKVLARLAEKQSISGFSKDEFLELVDTYKRSGFGHVGNDVAYLDDLMPPSLTGGLRNGGKTIMDWGTTFFREGERTARGMAFAAAYGERKASKAGKLNRADEAWILQRAKDLTGNMTRDSNAGWQKGYGAVVTQFMGFQMRLMEQMIGSKLTLAEKSRLFAGMSFMYGVPVAGGMTLGVLPVREWLKDWLTKEGIEYDGTVAEPFMDGFAATILELATGSDLNVSERYGPGGISTFYDFFKGESDIQELLLGASGGIIGETIKDANPIWNAIASTIDLDDTTNYPITVSDLIEPLRNISTVNNFVKYNEAVNVGRWLSQNENALTEVSEVEAFISATLGLDPQRVSDAYSQLDATSAWKDHQSALRTEAIMWVRRSIQANADKNYEDADRFVSRAKALMVKGGFTLRQTAGIYMDAADKTTMDESVMEGYTEAMRAKNRVNTGATN